MSLNVALAMPAHTARAVFPARSLDPLEPALTLLSRDPIQDFTSPEGRSLLAEADILLTGWGCPVIDHAVLDAAPRLRYVLHAAGSVKHHIGDACWERGIQISSAADANAIPVAEYTVAMIILANKRVLQIARALHTTRTDVLAEQLFPDMGNYRKRVGIIGASKIGRHVIRLLAPYELEVVVADPYLSPDEAAVLGVRLVCLEELVAGSDVVSLHAPSLPSTKNLIDAGLIDKMRPGTTFINTSRGELVDQDALLVRVERGDLYAVLDVTTPWVLPAGSPFYTHPNVLLTPHVAGSLGNELERMAASAVDEALRLSRGEPLRFPVRLEDLAFTA
ncbi:phosphoglycerate dehydrogenase-like enzyme [Paenarthrobacter nitroguajacolicus]|uniref:hydroxyacid dehydrogenase n=1 Tax=Paenarthrobacter TaxID=1742992 RepID=UPI002865A08D|nr:hydroxyacid dehydrogenase [Paenarthrobacter nitroguajacolicus]MDR6988332.1 phosphoglycerate dehydrogenase-like enzyme [Paenarthrobacter nitroguajacolicus]